MFGGLDGSAGQATYGSSAVFLEANAIKFSVDSCTEITELELSNSIRSHKRNAE